MKRGSAQCKIVLQDWLADSIGKNRKVAVTAYLLSNVLKPEQRRRLAEKQKARAAELADRAVNTSIYMKPEFLSPRLAEMRHFGG